MNKWGAWGAWGAKNGNWKIYENIIWVLLNGFETRVSAPHPPISSKRWNWDSQNIYRVGEITYANSKRWNWDSQNIFLVGEINLDQFKKHF